MAEMKWEWLDPEIELLADPDEFVLVICSGRSGGCRYENAYELATYNNEDGWCLENGREDDEITVKCWAFLPNPPWMKEG